MRVGRVRDLNLGLGFRSLTLGLLGYKKKWKRIKEKRA